MNGGGGDGVVYLDFRLNWAGVSAVVAGAVQYGSSRGRSLTRKNVLNDNKERGVSLA